MSLLDELRRLQMGGGHEMGPRGGGFQPHQFDALDGIEEIPMETPTYHPEERFEVGRGGRFLDALAQALAANPTTYEPRRGAGQGENFLGGLLQGAGRGFAGSRLGAMRERESQAERNRKNIELSSAARTLALQEHMKRKQDREMETFKTDEEIRKGRALMKPEKPLDVRAHEAFVLGEASSKGHAAGNPKSATLSRYGVSDDEVMTYAKGLVDGSIPPDKLGFRYEVPVTAAAKRIDPNFNLTRLRMDYTSALGFYRQQNSGIQLRLRQAIENASETVDTVEGLATELDAVLSRPRLASLVKVQNSMVNEGIGSKDQIQKLQNLTSFIAALNFELANVYQGGGVPTDKAKDKADQIINVNMPPTRLRGAIQAAKREINIRRNAISNAGVFSPSNPIGQPPGTINLGENPMNMGGDWQNDEDFLRDAGVTGGNRP